MQHLTYTEPGHNHRNEDVVLVRPHPNEPELLLCALADGQGGQSGGGEASRLAAEKCLEQASQFSSEMLVAPSFWYGILSGADESVSDDPNAGFTTLIGLSVSSNRVCGASCGDSMAILVADGEYKELTDEQRKNPPVGSRAAYPVVYSAVLHHGWKLIMMSDGVWRYVGSEVIAELCQRRHGQELISALRQLQAEQNGGRLPDDFSMILVEQTIA